MAEVKKKDNKSHQKNKERFVQMSIMARWHVLEDFLFLLIFFFFGQQLQFCNTKEQTPPIF